MHGCHNYQRRKGTSWRQTAEVRNILRWAQTRTKVKNKAIAFQGIFRDAKNIIHSELLFSVQNAPGTDLSGTPTWYGVGWIEHAMLPKS